MGQKQITERFVQYLLKVENMYDKFIKQNQKLWSNYIPKESGSKILIEEASIPALTHLSALFSIILNQGKKYTPVWIFNETYDSELMQSYVKTSKSICLPKLHLKKVYLLLMSALLFFKAWYSNDILSISYDDVKYGDIVYDTYLNQKQVGTIKKNDIRIILIIYFCIIRHERISKILRSDDAFNAVLVTHQIGLNGGVMLRTALRYGYTGYLRAGHNLCTLQKLESLDEVYDYPYKPHPKDIDQIFASLDKDFNSVYERIYKQQTLGKYSMDALYAFSEKNKYYCDRNSFDLDYKLDCSMKNVFVMLHAFTDHPHSHFRRMIFNDYYDWFIQTLNFAKKNNTVNWIFKQHPSIRYYPIKDVSFSDLFLDTSKNIVYIDENNQIDTRSLIHCANLVVTCMGSAGFELPAMGGVPSVTAGDNPYSNLGFALEPKTKEEYFTILRNANNIESLSPEQQKRAQAAYMYIYDYSKVNMSACPIMSHAEEKDKNMFSWYWKKCIAIYDIKSDTILKELNRYISEVSNPNFKRLSSFREELKENNNHSSK